MKQRKWYTNVKRIEIGGNSAKNRVHEEENGNRKDCQRWIHIRMTQVRGNVFCKEIMGIVAQPIYWTSQQLHTHAPSPTQVELTKLKVGIKYKVKTTEETQQKIQGKRLGNISEDATAIRSL